MSPSSTAKCFRDLIEEVGAGSEDAAWRLVEEYGPHVQRFVRRALHRQLRSKFDSIDFVQVVWASIFREPEKLQSIQRPEDLIAFLATIARNKVLDEVRRRMQCAKYNVAREVRMGAEEGEQHDGFPASGPTPSAVAIAKERWDRLLSDKNSNVRSIVTLRLQGVSFVEIADRLQINERTARKKIKELTSGA